VSGGAVVLRGRSGRDVTASYPEAAAALARAGGRRTLILDGEVAVFDGDNPSFAQLQRRMHVGRPAPALVAAVPVTYIAFDLLWQAGRSLLRSPYAQRRALLDGLALAQERLSVPPAFPGQARALADASRELGLEGVVLKRLSSSYQPGQRSGDWLKIRNLAAADVLIGGWLPRAGARSQLAGSVLAGAPGPDGLEYLGSVGSGLAEAERRDLTARLLALEQPESPFAAPPSGRRRPPGTMDASCAGGRGRLRRDHACGADAAPRLARAAARVSALIGVETCLFSWPLFTELGRS
jgi:bifunctional non-homologous end joining protein LigD